MFARTDRLLLRPGFIEDAPELVRAISTETIARNLARLPWPYTEGHARDWLSLEPVDPRLPNMLILQRTSGTPRIVGGVGIHLLDDDTGGARPEIGYWVARQCWGLGFATEAGRAVMAIARTLRLPRLMSGHFVDNPASGAVLRKLGFTATGRIVPRYSVARGENVACALFEEGDADNGAAMPRPAPIGMRCRVPTDDDVRQTIRLLAA